MSQDRIAPGLMAAMALLTAVPAIAADTPEVAEQKRQMSQTYHGFHAHGNCRVFADVGVWQKANWPEGKPVVQQFLQEKILPRYMADPAAMKDKTPDALMLEYLRFCNQTGSEAEQILSKLESADAGDEAKPLRDSMLAARFLGECQTASEVYLKGNPEHKDPIRRLVFNEVYAKDPKYRQFKRPSGKLTEDDVLAIMQHA